MIEWRIEVIGGPYDGASGLALRLEAEQDPPDRIRLGVCSGHGECNYEACGRAARPARHVAFWIPELEDAPVATDPYELEGFEEPMHTMLLPAGERPVARYVIGGLGALLKREEEAICYG